MTSVGGNDWLPVIQGRERTDITKGDVKRKYANGVPNQWSSDIVISMTVSFGIIIIISA